MWVKSTSHDWNWLWVRRLSYIIWTGLSQSPKRPYRQSGGFLEEISAWEQQLHPICGEFHPALPDGRPYRFLTSLIRPHNHVSQILSINLLISISQWLCFPHWTLTDGDAIHSFNKQRAGNKANNHARCHERKWVRCNLSTQEAQRTWSTYAQMAQPGVTQ